MSVKYCSNYAVKLHVLIIHTSHAFAFCVDLNCEQRTYSYHESHCVDFYLSLCSFRAEAFWFIVSRQKFARMPLSIAVVEALFAPPAFRIEIDRTATLRSPLVLFAITNHENTLCNCNCVIHGVCAWIFSITASTVRNAIHHCRLTIIDRESSVTYP